MRTSGEARAFEHDDDDESGKHDDDARTEPGTWASTPTRTHPLWNRIEPPKRRLPPLPEHLSRSTWARLCRQIVAFLRTRLNNNVSLRSLVRMVRAEMLLTGATSEEVAAALRTAVTEHPELSTLDRTNMLTRRLASEELVDQLLAWLDEAETR